VSLTLGAIAAGFVAKACERATDRAAEIAVDGGEGVFHRLLARVRERFAGDADAAGSLALVERAPDSAVLVRELGERIDRVVHDDPEFGSELERLVAQAQSAGIEVRSISQTASGSGIVQIGEAPGSELHISAGSHRPSNAAG
jgi:hypothetical protein